MELHDSSPLRCALNELGTPPPISITAGINAKCFPSLPDLQDSICKKCAKIDFIAVSEPTFLPDHGEFVLRLGSPAALASSRCPLCRFFASISPLRDADDVHKRRHIVHLRAFSAYKAIAGIDYWLSGSLPRLVLGVVSIPTVDIENEPHIAAPRLISSLRKTGFIFLADEESHNHPSSGYSVRFMDSHRFDMDIAREWRSYCWKNHTMTCLHVTQSHPKSLRLIDCRTREIVECSTRVEYAALSYVWGEAEPMDAQQQIDVLSEQHKLDRFPKTIEDSMQVAMDLDIWYLWVDRYCIDQSNKHDQIQQMDAIYRSAGLTIIAAAGDGPNHGLPGVNGTPRLGQQTIRIGDCVLVQSLPHPSSVISECRWASRGW
jgi:hypothetical protein